MAERKPYSYRNEGRVESSYYRDRISDRSDDRNRNRSRSYQSERYGQAYNYGNTAVELEPKQPQEDPRRRKQRRRKSRETEQKKARNPQVNKNLQREEVVDVKYVVVLTAIVIALGVAFVSYLRLETAIMSRSSNITALQMEISDLTMENDAALDAIEDSVDLNTIKEKAESLGMEYISSSQVVGYQSPTADYVIQYEEIPSSGVLAQSDSVLE